MGERPAALLRAARSASRLRLPIDEATQTLVAVAADANEDDLLTAIEVALALPAHDRHAARAREILLTALDVRLFPAA